jgi:hypothetical protein
MSTTQSRPDVCYIAIDQGDRVALADLLLAEVLRLEADVLTRRRGSPARKQLIERAFRMHELAVRIGP